MSNEEDDPSMMTFQNGMSPDASPVKQVVTSGSKPEWDEREYPRQILRASISTKDEIPREPDQGLRESTKVTKEQLLQSDTESEHDDIDP
jgi:hypothetical protein